MRGRIACRAFLVWPEIPDDATALPGIEAGQCGNETFFRNPDHMSRPVAERV